MQNFANHGVNEKWSHIVDHNDYLSGFTHKVFDL